MYNKHLSTILSLVVFSVLFLSSVDTLCQDNEDMVKINTSAGRELSTWLEKIPIGDESDYGFIDRNDFNRVRLLDPINILFPSSIFFSSEYIDTAKVNFYSTQYWKIPISVDGKICCFLQGKFIDSKFKVFGIGGKTSAQTLNSLNETFFTYDNMQRSILMFPDMRKEYIVYFKNGLTYKESICVSLSDFFSPTSTKSEQSLFETLYQCKNYSTMQ